MGPTLGCSTITWRPTETPLEEQLRAIAAVGYAGTPAGYREGASAAETRRQLDSFGLRPAPGYLSGRWEDPADRERILELAHRHADWEAELGCGELFVAGHCFPERFAVAGHETANRADQLSDDQYRHAADLLDEVGRICAERGVKACLHNHAGSYFETRDEVDRILALTDPSLLYVGLDTGHLAYGGGDVVDFCARYAPRIKALHLKDVFPEVLARGRREKMDYHTLQANGLWAEPGSGCVDFVGAFERLRAAGFGGWAIVEVDRTSLASPEESIRRSWDYLTGLGLSA